MTILKTKIRKNDVFLCVSEDELELRYKLNSNRDAEVLRSSVPSLADGRLHAVTVSRELDSVSIQVIALRCGVLISSVTAEALLLGNVDFRQQPCYR